MISFLAGAAVAAILKAKKENEEKGLGAPRHDGIAKEALDECGRLKPGYKFSQGRILKVKEKEKAEEIEPKQTSKVIEIQPNTTPVIQLTKTVKKEVKKDVGGNNKMNDFKRMFTLLEEYAQALKDDAIIPFREAKILWHEGKQVYEDKPAYSFKELHQYILDIWKEQKNPLFDFGYDKLKVNIEWADDLNMDFRMDLGFSDFYPLQESPEEYIRNYIFYKVYQSMFDDLTQDFGFNIKTDDINKLALLQFGDDYDAFDYLTFITRGNMYLMKNKGFIEYPNLYINEKINPGFIETSQEWVAIIKDYAKELGRTPAVKAFLENAEYNFETKRDLIYKNNFHKLPEKKNIPVTIETKSFDIQKTTESFEKADRRKTTSLLKKYIKDVFRIKTSIKSDVYSGGSSLNVSYNLGPNPDLISPIINRLQYGNFNGMDDSYNMKSGSDRGFYLDNFALTDFKYTFVSREFPKEFKIIAAKAFSKSHEYGEKIPTFSSMTGNTDEEKMYSYFKDPINHYLSQYSGIVDQVLADASFETQDYKQIDNLTYKEDRKDDSLDNWFKGYFTYTIKGKKYDTREYKEGTSKLVKAHKAVIKNIQIINIDKTQFAVVGYLDDIKNQLIKIGGEYRKTVNIKGFSENLNGVFFNKKHLEEVTNVVLQYVEEEGLNGPNDKNNYKYEYEFLKTIGLTGPQHTGVAKKALNNCGRLKPGYKFSKGGKIEKTNSNKKSDPLKAKVVKHLKAMSLEEFANDYAYLFSADLDKVLYRIEDKKTHKEYIDKLAEKAIKDNRLDVVGFEKKKTKAKSKKNEQLSLFGLSGNLSINTDQFNKMTVTELRKFTLQYYREVLKDKKIAIENSLKQVEFVNKSGRKIAKGGAMYKEKAAIIEHLETVIKNSTYNNFGKPKLSDKKDVLGYLNFKSKLLVDGKKRHVRISVILYENRKTILKNYDLGEKKKSNLNSKGSDRLPSNVEKKSLSRNKNTKTKPNHKKGLGNPVIVDVASELDNTPVIVENNQPEQKEQPAANVFKEVTKAAAPSTPKSPDTQDQKQSAKPKKDVMSSADIMNMDFDSLDFTGKWLDFMQDPAKNMRIAIWGKPKNGKTAGATTLANYLTNFGSVLYNFSDQGFNKSTKDLWQLSGLSNKPNAYAVATRDLEELDKLCASGDYDFVFIDMINTYIHRTGIKYFEFEDRFLKKYPNISFILIFEVTKNGDFKGDQGWTHLVDAVVTVDSFVMENQGRYGVGHYVVWEEGLKKTNPKKYNEFIDETEKLEPLPSEMQIDL